VCRGERGEGRGERGEGRSPTMLAKGSPPGTRPVKPLKSRSSSSSLVRPANDAGIEPLKWFTARDNLDRLVRYLEWVRI
jgi:hypothetical protein